MFAESPLCRDDRRGEILKVVAELVETVPSSRLTGELVRCLRVRSSELCAEGVNFDFLLEWVRGAFPHGPDAQAWLTDELY